MKWKNLHLTVSAIVVILVGLSYGICPGKVLPLFVDLKVESIDVKNLLRAMMGLYLALAAYWLLGIFKPVYWYSATVICTLFMGGLGLGRIIGIVLDGLPSLTFIMGMVLEATSMFWGLTNLRKAKGAT